ncbi:MULTISPECIES: Fe-S cluster assembly protein SufD [unclassified Thermoactinomyces]|uniref:Fe-S cluster assembly protein SufD n=1 Tax=unclassified Thermoactinomyces TaxID=2634588 RepID=UPI0018DE0FDE|nr:MULTISPECIES: Fe-S cluster assembly protein SufD [unclassified Thermoactinomyces]MBH8599029.1 Fe-S cluster assembly protein SufD [Thermoactinomyces sp. CICC 10523]MBH8605016.1 Fe-S cluster assembly protein SufD [Thermoactinomyces sp. CICC 10522]MBH8608456.1 Fe-S cluster assembly protein SufD [Thermoactinomyces sp. CICC 10521]
MSVETRMLFDENVVTEVSKKQQEPEWMLQSRLEALRAAARLPLPQLQKTNIDRWNFTDFNPYKDEAPIKELSELPENIARFLVEQENSGLFIQKNSSVIFQNLSAELADKGIIFTDLATAARDHEELVKVYFMNEGVKRDEHQLTALHAALFSGGIFLYIPRGVEVTVPLQAMFWLSGGKNGMLPHVLLVAEDHSRVDFVANFVSDPDDGGAVSNSVIEAFVGANADVRIATVNTLGESVVDVIYRRSVVDRDGRLEWIVADLSDGRLISDNTSSLRGEGGSVNVKAVVLGTGEMRGNVTSYIRHLARNTASEINARSVMKDQASSILNSITKIEKGASKSDGQQSGKVLMLGEKARGDANPILLIDENDVAAGHAASVGRIDPLQLYYLMSRGISRTEAERLIIYGFLDTVLSQIPSEALRKSIHRVIERKFANEKRS